MRVGQDTNEAPTLRLLGTYTTTGTHGCPNLGKAGTPHLHVRGNMRVSLLNCSSRHAGFRLPRLCATIGRSGITCRAFLRPTSFAQGTTHAFHRHASWNSAFKHVSRQLCKHENLRSGVLRTPLRTTVRTLCIVL